MRGLYVRLSFDICTLLDQRLYIQKENIRFKRILLITLILVFMTIGLFQFVELETTVTHTV